MTGFTISDLKKHLGPGLGLRKNKYLIEVPVPGATGESINILCRSAGLPERTINTHTLWHKGRKFNIRGETNYGDTYEFSVVDDSEMQLRRIFDRWLRLVDDSKPKNLGILGASYESGVGDVLKNIKSGIAVVNQVRNAVKNPDQAADFLLGLIDGGNGYPTPTYQIDVNIWQLSAVSKKVYGYKLQNAFPSSLGIVTLEDEQENTLSEFSVVLTFSEFAPLEETSLLGKAANAILGDDIRDIRYGIESFVR
jgi:hypothetical protein